MTQKKIENKKAVFVIAFNDFKDEEYYIPKDVLEKAGIKVSTASNSTGEAIGADGMAAEVDLSLENLKVDDFDAILFVGGPGALDNLDNEKSYQIAKESVEKDKILGAICISPMILAKAGVLEGKNATVWSSILDKSPIKTLEEYGAFYENEDVVTDGRIITANGPHAAQDFGNAVLELLKKE